MKYEIKRFSIVQDINRSGLNRTLKRGLGRIRTKIAGKLVESIKNNHRGIAKSYKKFENISTTKNPEIKKKLLRDAKKEGARTFREDIGSKMISVDVAKKSKQEQLFKNPTKISNSYKDNKYLIVHPGGSGNESLAHEIGHIKNGKGIISKYINKVGNNSKTREEFSKMSEGNDGKVGIFESGKRYLKGLAIVQEEKNATRKGIDLLKKHGMSKEELKLSKEKLDLAGKTYEGLSKAYWKTPLMNKIQIPSRRQTSGFN